MACCGLEDLVKSVVVVCWIDLVRKRGEGKGHSDMNRSLSYSFSFSFFPHPCPFTAAIAAGGSGGLVVCEKGKSGDQEAWFPALGGGTNSLLRLRRRFSKMEASPTHLARYGKLPSPEIPF